MFLKDKIYSLSFIKVIILLIFLLILAIISFFIFEWKSQNQSWFSENTPKKLGIYYWYPSYLNSSKNNYQLDKVVEDLNQYDSIVLWGNLENPLHEDYQNTNDILNGTDSFLWYKWKSYGYITLKNTLSSIENSVDEWKKLGVNGIFFDEAWYDFLIDNYIFQDKLAVRNHQNTAINYAHSKGLRVIMNAWNVDDIFWIENWENPTTLQAWDTYLLESFVYNPLAIKTQYDDYKNQTDKIKKSLQYKNDFGIELHCAGLLPNTSDITPEKVKNFYEKTIWVCDYIQITQESFWAENSTLINYLQTYK